MRRSRKLAVAGVAAAVLAATAAAVGGAGQNDFTSVAGPVGKVTGVSAPDVLPKELAEVVRARGDMRLDGGTSAVPYYGFDGDVSRFVPAANAQAAAGTKVEASKTEPDKNTYLVLTGKQFGADASYDYGHHFVFQGHELGSPGYLTRVNLDADDAHRVTLMAAADVNGAALPDWDGSTWDPFAQRILLTAELGSSGGVWAAEVLGVPAAKVVDVSGAMGRGGYEGIQTDSAGNEVIVEDAGGGTGSTFPNSRQPNSFLYRYVPAKPGDLSNGKLQVLQVLDQAGAPITFHADNKDLDIKNDGIKAEYTYGVTLTTKWVTIHDTGSDGNKPFDANALAKAKGGTPLKRPENGVFKPDGTFTDFYFTTTGDTNATTAVGADYGGFGGLHHLVTSPTGDTGTLTLLYKGDVGHTGFDNIAFLAKDRLVAVEDAGDTLHTQRGFFDCAYVFNVDDDYSKPTTNAPVRLIAQGRDALATVDSTWSGQPGFQNDGDNEITGIHMSDGDATRNGLLGAKEPQPWDGKWRLFYTQQHGLNTLYEIVRK